MKADVVSVSELLGENEVACLGDKFIVNLSFQTDYKGEIKLCKRYSKNKIKDIFAKVVRQGDFFMEEVDGGKQNVQYRPKPFSNEQMIGAFAIVVFEDGSMMYDTMSSEDIENVRNTYSKAKDSQAWKSSTGGGKISRPGRSSMPD